MCVSVSTTNFPRNHSEMNCARHNQKYALIITYSARFSCPIVMKLEFSGQNFGKYNKFKFNGNPSSGCPVVPNGQPDRHDKANSRLLQFCLSVWKHRLSLFVRQTECLLQGTSRIFHCNSYLSLERIQSDTKQELAARTAELLLSDKTEQAKGTQNTAVKRGQFL
jgi:hypothetical protein